MKLKRILPVLLLALLLIWLFLPETDGGPAVPAATAAPPESPAPSAALSLVSPTPGDTPEAPASAAPEAPDPDGVYTGRDEVALYLHCYGTLPSNFVTKKEAEKAGWRGGSLEKLLPGKCIGGDRFGNYEGLLPDAPGRRWTECDINTLGASSRGSERLVFSNDGLIYYTADHYESFELLYG